MEIDVAEMGPSDRSQGAQRKKGTFCQTTSRYQTFLTSMPMILLATSVTPAVTLTL